MNWNSKGMGSTYIWNSECLKMLILWTLHFVNEARLNNATLMMTAKVQDTGEASIDLVCVEENR